MQFLSVTSTIGREIMCNTQGSKIHFNIYRTFYVQFRVIAISRLHCIEAANHEGATKFGIVSQQWNGKGVQQECQKQYLQQHQQDTSQCLRGNVCSKSVRKDGLAKIREKIKKGFSPDKKRETALKTRQQKEREKHHNCCPILWRALLIQQCSFWSKLTWARLTGKFLLILPREFV